MKTNTTTKGNTMKTNTTTKGNTMNNNAIIINSLEFRALSTKSNIPFFAGVSSLTSEQPPISGTLDGRLGFTIGTGHDLKWMYELSNGGYYFSRKTMAFFGDTMRNYNLTTQHGEGRVFKAYDDNGVFTNLCYELTRREAVKNNQSQPSYFDIETFNYITPTSVKPQIKDRGLSIFDDVIINSVQRVFNREGVAFKHKKLFKACDYILSIFNEAYFGNMISIFDVVTYIECLSGFLACSPSQLDMNYTLEDMRLFYKEAGFNTDDQDILTVSFYKQIAVVIIQCASANYK